MERKMFVIYALVARGPNIIADYASQSCMDEDEEHIQKFAQNLVRQLKPQEVEMYQMQSYHQADYSYHLMKIPNNINLAWATTKSEDSPSKANMFLTALEENVTDMLEMDHSTLSLGISKILQKMIDNIDDYVDTDDKLRDMEYELTDITESMKDNLNSILSRGEKFNSLIQKSEKLKASSQTFSSRARLLKKQGNWDKLWILWVLILGIVIFLIVFRAVYGIK